MMTRGSRLSSNLSSISIGDAAERRKSRTASRWRRIPPTARAPGEGVPLQILILDPRLNPYPPLSLSVYT
jgi:hypothetical protein